mgnify:CR=1 FL=1
MTRSREIFHVDQSDLENSKKGMFITKKQGFVFLIFFVIGSIFAAWLSHYFTSKSLLNNGNVLEKKLNDCLLELKEKDIDFFDDEEIVKIKLENLRLPKSVVPDSYDVKLIPFLSENNFTFNGEIKILINVTENTNNVTLHVNDIEIYTDSIALEDAKSGQNVSVLRVTNDTERQFFIIYTNLEKDHQYNVKINYVGHLNDRLKGFYRSSYDVNGTKR